MSLPTQQQYERTERTREQAFHNQLAAAPLSDRQEARADYTEALEAMAALELGRHTGREDFFDRVIDGIGHVIAGNYGIAAYLMVREALGNKRMNRAAYLGTMVAAHEFNCPADFARGAYTSLSPVQQASVNAAFARAIAEYEEAEAQEAILRAQEEEGA